MTTIYFKDANGQKVAVEVTEEVAAADKETRQAGWRNDSYERSHRDPKLHDLNDHDEELANEKTNPETMYIAAEDAAERREQLITILKSLTPTRLELVKLLKKGMTVSQIARLWGKNQKTVCAA